LLAKYPHSNAGIQNADDKIAIERKT